MSYLTMVFLALSQTFNLPPGLLSSLCFVESGHNENAIHIDDNGSDSLGLCQVKLSTAKFMGFKGTEEELHHSAAINAYYAARYLAYQRQRYNGSLYCAIASYNAGSCLRRNNGKARNDYYVQKVYKAWEEETKSFKIAQAR